MIINLQKTPKDNKADLVIHAKCDAVMQQVMAQLQIALPAYTRQDAVYVSHTVKKAKSFRDDAPSFSCTIHVHSVHGPKSPLPLVQQVNISFQVFFSKIDMMCTLTADLRCRSSGSWETAPKCARTCVQMNQKVATHAPYQDNLLLHVMSWLYSTVWC